jgi:hypothetical protein
MVAGKLQRPPHHCRCLALTSMVRPIPLSAPGPKSISGHRQPGGGKGKHTATYTPYIVACTALSQRLISATGVLRPDVRISRLNVKNSFKITKSTNFKAYSSREAPSKPGRGGPGLRQTSWYFCTLQPGWLYIQRGWEIDRLATQPPLSLRNNMVGGGETWAE